MKILKQKCNKCKKGKIIINISEKAKIQKCSFCQYQFKLKNRFKDIHGIECIDIE